MKVACQGHDVCDGEGKGGDLTVVSAEEDGGDNVLDEEEEEEGEDGEDDVVVGGKVAVEEVVGANWGDHELLT